MRFLVDSGSDVYITPASRKYKLHGPSEFQLHAAPDRKSAHTVVSLFTTDRVLRRRSTWNFFLAYVTIAIIGADFLANFSVVVDLRNHQLIDGFTKLQIVGGFVDAAVHSVTYIDQCHPYHDLFAEFRETSNNANNVSSSHCWSRQFRCRCN